jgi:DNA-binding response OmpR family regulator
MTAAPATILTVDDDPEVREFASVVLAEAGYRVLDAKSGEAALQVIEDEPEINLLITDIVMPGLNGLDFARLAQARRPEMKVLFASGYWAHIVNSLSLDREQLMAKPYRAAELVERVRRALGEALA